MRRLPFAATLCAGLGLHAASHAGDPSPPGLSCAPEPEAPSSDPVVVTVGSSHVRASELGALLAGLSDFERRTYGATPGDLRRGFAERRLIPGLLAAQRACELRSDSGTALGARLTQELVERLDADITRSIESQLTPGEIRAYCQAEPRDGGGLACSGDPVGYRVALTRTKKSQALAKLVAELREKHVHPVSYAPLEEIEVTAAGVRAVGAGDAR